MDERKVKVSIKNPDFGFSIKTKEGEVKLLLMADKLVIDGSAHGNFVFEMHGICNFDHLFLAEVNLSINFDEERWILEPIKILSVAYHARETIMKEIVGTPFEKFWYEMGEMKESESK